MHIFICENSLDGILTGVYEAWSAKLRLHCEHSDIQLLCEAPDNYALFCDYEFVENDSIKAESVSNTLITKLGQDFFDTIVNAALSKDLSPRQKMDKADAIHHTIVLGITSKAGPKVLEYLGNPHVYRVFELARMTGMEAHHLMGFLRFAELKNGVLFSEIHPKNNALPILAEHFTDRFPQENFMIYDDTRKMAAIHRAGKNFMLVDASDINQELLSQYSNRESQFQELWLAFFESIAIEARTNPKLQAQNIPKRFWGDALELRGKL